MRILIAPQEFKGTLSAAQAAAAIAEALRQRHPEWQLDLLPMADGGPGTLEALLTTPGSERRFTEASDPLLRPITAEWGLLPNHQAVIECAAASGLWRLQANERDPRRASSFGTGQLISAALDAGCERIDIGLGGSATNDAGAGMAQALGYRLLDDNDRDLPPGGAALARLSRIDASSVHAALAACRFRGLTDVSNPLHGPEGASHVYGPQKGADAQAVSELDAALAHAGAIIKRDLGVEVANQPGAGAAGGLGAGLLAFLSAELQPGARIIAEITGLASRIALADAVITGEGRLDNQTGFGKGPAYVAALAQQAGRPCVCIAGRIAAGADTTAFSLVETAGNNDDNALPTPEASRAQLKAATDRVILNLVRLIQR